MAIVLGLSLFLAAPHRAHGDSVLMVSSPTPNATISHHFRVVGTTTSRAYIRVTAIVHLSANKNADPKYFGNNADKAGNYYVELDLGRHPPGTQVDLSVYSVDTHGRQTGPINESVTMNP